MTAFSVLVLIVYLTVAFYVVYRARQNLIDEKLQEREAIASGKAVVKPLTEDLEKRLNTQLEPLGLKVTIQINLGRERLVEIHQLNQWKIQIENQTTTYALFLDWTKSSITNLQGQARELACLTPNRGLSQSASLTPPLDRLQESFVVFSDAEALVPFADSGALLKNFQQGKEATLTLRLVLQLKEVGRYTNSYTLVLSCVFQLRAATVDDVELFFTGGSRF